SRPAPWGSSSMTPASRSDEPWRITPVDERRIAAALRDLDPAVKGSGWDDVLRRGGRMRRRRRQRTVVVAVAAGVIALVGALAAGGQIGSLLAHSKEPHLELGAVLKGGDGRRIGTLELELHGAAVVFGRGVELRRWTPAHSELVSGAPFGVRWFLDLDDAAAARAGGSLVVATPSGSRSILPWRRRLFATRRTPSTAQAQTGPPRAPSCSSARACNVPSSA